MTKTIAIVNEKGGTGKTTTAVNLSAALGEAGRKVLLVDLDGQAASSRWLKVEDDTRFADALWKGEPFEPIPEVIPGVWLAPGSGKLDSVAHDLRPTQGGQLRKVLSLLEGFDYVIIDCPPSLGNRLIGNAMLAATHAIVPVETSILALDGLRILLTTFQDVRDGFGHEIALAGVLACRYDARTRLSRFVLSELHRALPGKVFRTVIRENIRMRECPGSGRSILAYAPDSHAAEDYRALAQEVLAGRAGADVQPTDGAGAEADLTQKECQAIREIRDQISALLHRTGSAEASAPGPETVAADVAPPGDLHPQPIEAETLQTADAALAPVEAVASEAAAAAPTPVGAEASEVVVAAPTPAESPASEAVAAAPTPVEAAPLQAASQVSEDHASSAPSSPIASEPFAASPAAGPEMPPAQEARTPVPPVPFAPLTLPVGVDVEARAPHAHLDRVVEGPEEPTVEEECVDLSIFAESVRARVEGLPEESAPPAPADKPTGLEALRAVLQSLKQTGEAGQAHREGTKGSVLRRLFSKRSA